jgi:GntR family transcriptional regulator
MRRAHVRAGAHVVSALQVDATPEVRAALDLQRRQQVYEIVRVRLANREPLALEDTFLAVHDFPGLLDHRLTGSLYALMRRTYDLTPHTAREYLEPVVADDEEARLLETEPGSALMLVTRTAYTASGRPIEHAYDRYRADRTRIALQTGIAHRQGIATSVRAELRAEGSP